jgi:mannose-1-phosphate guanylyltransferase
MLNKNRFGLVLAGGVGSRLWPISTPNTPKQFIDVLGDGESMIKKTCTRLEKVVGSNQICFLTNKNYTSQIIEHVNLNNKRRVFEEPTMRNTAPALALASYKLFKENPDALLLVCPSDQLINNEDEFKRVSELAFSYLEKNDSIITFGIQPDHPNTGYGYIKYKNLNNGIADVEQFTEKPNEEKAQEFLNEGVFLWNAGIFAWKASFFVALVEKYLPEIARVFQDNFDVLNSEKEETFLQEFYPTFENISVDYAILEKCTSVKVIPVDMSWDDLGTFTSIEKHIPKQEENVIVGNSLAYQESSKNNFIFTQTSDEIILVGVEDLAIIQGNGKLVITKKSELPNLKQIAKDNNL